MGANTFIVTSSGKTAREAFQAATAQARHEYGHRGYTGTIAEKHDFVIINDTAMAFSEAQRFANKLIDNEDRRIDDKWGPAGAIRLDSDEWLFFGWASA